MAGNEMKNKGKEKEAKKRIENSGKKDFRIGIADTMFSRYDMGALAESTIKKHVKDIASSTAIKVKVVRYTVPGIKDLPVASKKLLEEYSCDIALALGMVGGAEIDVQCAHEASMGIINAQLMANKHILGIFVFENEAKASKSGKKINEAKLKKIFIDRTVKHAINAVEMLKGKDALQPYSGKGKRQGSEDAGQL